jgi:hypothetical protein
MSPSKVWITQSEGGLSENIKHLSSEKKLLTCKVKLSCNKSCRLRSGMGYWASIMYYLFTWIWVKHPEMKSQRHTLLRIKNFCFFLPFTSTPVFATRQITWLLSGAFAKFEKWLLTLSCPSVRSSVCPQGTTRLPLDGFWRNLIFETFSSTCRGNLSVSNTWQENFTWRPMYLYDNISLNSS